jgi:hypothetical protein
MYVCDCALRGNICFALCAAHSRVGVGAWRVCCRIAIIRTALQVWCLAASCSGDFIVSGSHDRSLRRWQRTDEPFFVSEEKEKRLQSLFEAAARPQGPQALSEEARADGQVESVAMQTKVCSLSQ